MTIYYVFCKECRLRIEYVDRKDFESFSGIELSEHYHAEHPDKVIRDEQGNPIGLPYHGVYEVDEIAADTPEWDESEIALEKQRRRGE